MWHVLWWISPLHTVVSVSAVCLFILACLSLRPLALSRQQSCFAHTRTLIDLKKTACLVLRWNRATCRCRSYSRRMPRRSHRALAAAALGKGSSLQCRTRTKGGRRQLGLMVAAMEAEGFAASRGFVGHPLEKGEI